MSTRQRPLRAPAGASLEERFWVKVDKGAPDECWMWIGALDYSGYGLFRGEPVSTLAHRFSFWLANGYLPKRGQGVIDHVATRGCTSVLCVNPAHLEHVTNRENILRGRGPSAKNARKSECVNGHAFTPENTIIEADGGRGCRACRRAKERRRYAAAKAARTAI